MKRNINKRIIGVMIDAARQPESILSYKKLIDFCAEWHFNTILFRTADDQGLAIKLDKHPELLYHHDAFTQKEVKDLITYAGKKSIDIIPEVESFGHSKFITTVKEHAGLKDADESINAEQNGLCPVDPATLTLLKDIYSEVAELFSSKYFHGGCDEVNWGASKLSKEALKKRTKVEIWTDYLNSLHGIAKNLHKEFIVWGDYVLRKEPDIMNRLEKNIIIMDWDYRSTNSDEILKYANKAIEKGFRYIGGPALNWCKWGPRVGTEQLRNIDSYAESYRQAENEKYMGIILTNWCPWRLVANSFFDGFAYTSVAITEGAEVAKSAGFKKFVEKHYATKWNDAWFNVYSGIYDVVPQRQILWFNKETMLETFKDRNIHIPVFSVIESLLVTCEQTVRKNLDDFQAFKLATQYYRHLYWRIAVLLEEAQDKQDKNRTTRLIESIAEHDKQFYSLLCENWRKVHSEVFSSKFEKKGAKDQNVLNMYKASEYTTHLASHPKEFIAIINNLRKR